MGVAFNVVQGVCSSGHASVRIVSKTRYLAVGVTRSQRIAASVPGESGTYAAAVRNTHRIKVSVKLHCLNVPQLIGSSHRQAKLVECPTANFACGIFYRGNIA